MENTLSIKKEVRFEIYESFDCGSTLFFPQNTKSKNCKIKIDTLEFVSHEVDVELTVDPHLPLRCEQRKISNATFFLAVETFFKNEGVCPHSGIEFPTIDDVAPGEAFYLYYKRENLFFVFTYHGYDEFFKKHQVRAVTAYEPTKKKLKMYSNVFQIKTSVDGSLKCYYTN